MKNIAVIFAGGYGSRMHMPSKPKQFLLVNGKPLIIYTLEVFDQHPQIDAICIACVESWIPYLKKIIPQYGINKVVSIVPGGATSQDSIYNGLKASLQYVTECQEYDAFVLIHDGVRPLVLPEDITANIRMAQKFGNCISCAPATETFMISPKGGDSYVVAREESYIARAPQTFSLADILAVHEKARAGGRHDFIDSSTMMQYFGYRLHFCICSYENVKITTPADIFIFRAILKMREDLSAFDI